MTGDMFAEWAEGKLFSSGGSDFTEVYNMDGSINTDADPMSVLTSFGVVIEDIVSPKDGLDLVTDYGVVNFDTQEFEDYASGSTRASKSYDGTLDFTDGVD